MVGTSIAAATAASTPLFTSYCCYSYSSSYHQTKKFPSLPFISNSQFIISSSSHLSWNGLKRLPTITLSASFLKTKEKKRKLRGKVVHASLFGVGAPEALVIGVVALLVFGPKGLAEVARNLGKTLRAFQPTIRELQDVSREFKSTLEKEIGLDDISSTNNIYRPPSFPSKIQQPMADSNGTPKPEAYTSEELLKVTQEQLGVSPSGSQTQASSTDPQEQKQDLPSEDTTSTTTETATQSQLQSSEKADKER